MSLSSTLNIFKLLERIKAGMLIVLLALLHMLLEKILLQQVPVKSFMNDQQLFQRGTVYQSFLQKILTSPDALTITSPRRKKFNA